MERETMQRLEDTGTEGDDEGTVMLEKTCGMTKCIRANRKLKYG